MKKRVLQTLEDRGNPSEIEKEGPFSCDWPNTWLCEGYYFWDTFEENAHWWAKTRKFKSHVVCDALIDYSLNTCFDLVGTTEHLLDFSKSQDLIKKQNPKKRIKVARVLAFMKKTNSFPYHAVRAWGMLSKSPKKNKYKLRFEFLKTREQYLDTKPAIQLVIYDLDAVGFKDYKIIYPTHYISGYAV